VVLVEPEQRAGEQEAADLVPAVVEDEAAPVRVEPLAAVRVLVQVGAVEVGQRPGVGGEVARYPVEDHADPGLVQHVHEVHEVLRGAVPARRGEVPGRLVAPRREERVLGDRQQFDVGEPHVLAVRGELRADLAVVQRVVRRVGLPHPRPEVDLVDADRLVVGGLLLAGLHPLAVAPRVTHVPRNRGGLRRDLAGEGERVGLLGGEPAGGGDVVLVAQPGLGPGDEPGPHAAGADRPERVLALVPPVEVADDRDVVRVRCPHREVIARDPAARGRVRPELVVQAEVAPLVEQVQVLRAEPRLVGLDGGGGSRLNAEREELGRGVGLAHGRLGDRGATGRLCRVEVSETCPARQSRTASGDPACEPVAPPSHAAAAACERPSHSWRSTPSVSRGTAPRE
jgi:hypothetical protein